MKDYKALRPVTIPCGQIRLSDKQSEPRMEGLKATKTKGVFDVVAQQTFKAGEVIGLEDVSKALKPSLEEVAVAKKPAKVASK